MNKIYCMKISKFETKTINTKDLIAKFGHQFIIGKNIPKIIGISGFVFETKEFDECENLLMTLPLRETIGMAENEIDVKRFQPIDMSNATIPDIEEIQIHPKESYEFYEPTQVIEFLENEYDKCVINENQKLYVKGMWFTATKILNDKYNPIKFGRVWDKTKFVVHGLVSNMMK